MFDKIRGELTMSWKDFIFFVICLATAIIIVEGLLLVIFVAFKIMMAITTIVMILIVAFLIYDTMKRK